jgi:hypothetical protein
MEFGINLFASLTFARNYKMESVTRFSPVGFFHQQSPLDY